MKTIIHTVLFVCLQFLLSFPAQSALSALWLFEEDGGTVLDSSGNGNDGIIPDDPYDPVRTSGDDYFGNAMAFDGDAYIEVPADPSLDIVGDFSLSVRLFLTSYGDKPRTILFKYGNAQIGYRFKLTVKADGYFNLSMIDDVTGNKNYGGGIMELNQWMQIGIVRTKSTGDIQWYSNGVPGKKDNKGQTGNLGVSTSSLLIGAANNNGLDGFTGILDDVHIFNSALTHAEMAAIAKPRNNVLLAKMDTGSGTAVIDETIFHNDGEFGLSPYTPAWTQGDAGYGTALSFDGGDYVTIPGDTSINVLPNGITLSAYIYRTTDDLNTIVYKSATNGGFGYKLNVKTDGYLNLSLLDGSTVKNFSGFYVPPNTWTRCRVSVDMSAHKVVWYEGDQYRKASFFTEISSILETQGELLIGAGSTVGVNGFHGMIDDVEIYNSPILQNPESTGEFELTISDTGYFEPVLTGSINTLSYTIKNLKTSTDTYSVLVTDNHLLVGETLTLTTETLTAGQEKQVTVPIDASAPGVHKVSIEVMTTATPRTTVAKGTTSINVWTPIGNSYPDNVENFFGIMNLYEHHYPDKLVSDSKLSQDMGVKVARIIMRWKDLETDRGVYSWDKWDDIINTLNAYNIKPAPLLWSTPAWAYSQAHWDDAKAALGRNPINIPPADYNDYYNTMAALVSRYNHTRVPFWEIWNEPHLGQYWWYYEPVNDPYLSENNFITLLQGTYRAVKVADPDTKVIIGGQSASPGGFSDYVVQNSVGAYDIYSFHSHGDVIRHLAAHNANKGRIESYNPPMINAWWANETGYHYNVNKDITQAIALIKKGTISRYMGVKNFMWFILREKNPDTSVSFQSVDANGGLRPAVVSYNALVTLLHDTVPDQQLDLGDPQNYGYSFNRGYERVVVLWNEQDVNNTVSVDVNNGIASARLYNIFGAETSVPVVNGKVDVTLAFEPAILVLPANVQTQTLFSLPADDGWLREANENSNTGGKANSIDTGGEALRIGDALGDKQYKSIVSFDTSGIPANAVIQSAHLELTRGQQVGLDPYTVLGNAQVDLAAIGFGGDPALANGDFESPADLNNIALLIDDGNLAMAQLDESGRDAIAGSNRVQFRIGFELDDNDNTANDYVGYFSADHADPAKHPRMVVDYILP